MAGDEDARSAWGRTQQAMIAFDCCDILSAVRVPTLLCCTGAATVWPLTSRPPGA